MILFLDSGCRFCDFSPRGENAEWSRSWRLLSTQSSRGKWRNFSWSLKIAWVLIFWLMVCNGSMSSVSCKGCVCVLACSSSLTFRNSSNLCRAGRHMSWSFLRWRAVRTSSQPGGNSSVHRMSKRPGPRSQRGTLFPGTHIYSIDWHMNISSPSDNFIRIMQRKISLLLTIYLLKLFFLNVFNRHFIKVLSVELNLIYADLRNVFKSAELMNK